MIDLTNENILGIFQAYLKCNDKLNFTKTHNMGEYITGLYNCNYSTCMLFDKLYCENKSDLIELIGILLDKIIINDILIVLCNGDINDICYPYNKGITFPIHTIIASQPDGILLYIPNIMFDIYINYLTRKWE